MWMHNRQDTKDGAEKESLKKSRREKGGVKNGGQVEEIRAVWKSRTSNRHL